MLSLISASLLLAPQGHADLHAPQAEIYFEVPDVPALVEAYAQTAYARLLRDAAFQGAVGRVMGLESFDPWGELMGLLDEMESSGELPPLRAMLGDLQSLSLSLDVKGSPLELVQRLDHLDEDEVLERLAALLVLDFAQDSTAASVRDLIRDQTTLEAGIAWDEAPGVPGALLARGPGSDVDTFALVLAGPRLSLAIGGPALDRVLGQAPDDATSRVDPFASGRSLFGPATGATLFELRNDLSPALEPLLAEEPVVLPLIDLLEGLLGPEVAMVVHGGHWRVQLQDGRFLTEGLHPVPASPFANLFASRPLSDGALGLVQPDSVVAWATHFDKERALELVHQMHPEDDQQELERAYGFRLDRDLIGPMGPAITLSMPGSVSLMAAPPVQVGVALDDPAAFRRGVEGLFRMLADAGGSEVAVSSRDYRGYDIHTLRFEDLGLDLGDLPLDPSGMFQPSVVVLEDRALVALSPSHLKKEIRRVLKGEDAGAPAFAGQAVPAGACEVGYANWIDVVANLYSGLKSFVPMIASQGGMDLPVDLAALPEADVFTRFFEPSQRWKRRTEHGVLHRCVSSFGPEVLVLGSVAVVGATVSMREPVGLLEAVPIESVDPATPTTVTDQASDRTRADLRAVRVALSVYRLDRGTYPDDLQALSKPTESYPSGYLAQDAELQDAWGNGFRYERLDTGCRVWSLGPDGLEGTGDELEAD